MNEFDEKVAFFDKVYKWGVLLLVTGIFILVSFGVRQIFEVGYKVDSNVQDTKTIIENAQQSTLEAREANIERQEDLKSYVKCIVLLRYNYPDLNETSPKSDVETALDSCAEVE